jgi:hypothetical protein
MSYLLIEMRTGGLMSCFNLVTASLNYLNENKITDFYILWQNSSYQTTNENLFDKFFYQQSPPKQKYDNIINIFDIGEKVFSPITNVEVYIHLNKILNLYNYFSNPIYNEIYTICAYKPKSIGVHVRRTDHGIHGDILPNEYYFEKIDANLASGKYENIFLATDEYIIVEDFKKRYGDLLYTNSNITRSNNNVTIPQCNYLEKDKLAIDIFKEGISLSRCDKMIFTSSNIPSYVRLVNPGIDAEQIDTHIHFR